MLKRWRHKDNGKQPAGRLDVRFSPALEEPSYTQRLAEQEEALLLSAKQLADAVRVFLSGSTRVDGPAGDRLVPIDPATASAMLADRLRDFDHTEMELKGAEIEARAAMATRPRAERGL